MVGDFNLNLQITAAYFDFIKLHQSRSFYTLWVVLLLSKFKSVSALHIVASLVCSTNLRVLFS